ncbi:MAG: hypothetical protein A3G18_09400 [Rhodospirillales bacterium RIFCSPLOWO2_12_FULL_58_28]|nr:MAG: hypothetical protein A3H92_02270 [Rhodospirillales bacterium RIFCSPLOWO2_02_FULL_58_16]OHC76720.1 MAG: hypothetical protein A3G18_09400 [Rhodospirillales bacterium RIFCSPLOWO2_12_FULL_58_28]
MPSHNDVKLFYNEYYQSTPEDLNISENNIDSSPELINRVDFLLFYCSDKTVCSLLDFGAGLGGLAQQIKFKRPDWQLFATDVERKVNLLKEMNVFEKVYAEGVLIGRSFDIVAATGVWEHLLDPSASLSFLWEHVAPGGFLFLEVPNTTQEYHKIPDRMDIPHTLHFTSKSARFFIDRLNPAPDKVIIAPGGRPWEQEPINSDGGHLYSHDAVFQSFESYHAAGERGRDLRIIAKKPDVNMPRKCDAALT